MGKRRKVPNVALRRIREEERQETRSEFAESMARKAGELGESVSPSERYVARLEDGDVRFPHPAYRRVLIELCGRSIADLGFAPPNIQSPANQLLVTSERSPAVTPAQQYTVSRVAWEAPQSVRDIPGLSGIFAESEWPAWFAVKLAHLIAMVDSWQGPSTEINSLQTILHQEILMFNAVAPESQDSGRAAAHALSRRQALMTLAALPLTFATSNAVPAGTRGPAAGESFLAQCAASLTACWHLLRGSDLSTIDQMLSAYLLPLEGVARRGSKYQQAAGTLASQAHRICGIVALHRNQLKVRERHCKQALYYATVASDVNSQASALISLASTYFYHADPAQAAAIYERTSAFDADMPPLQRSRVHAELSVVYGQLGREQHAIRSAGLAEETYPDHPEQDPSYLYAEFTPASLTLEQGLAHIALAEHYPERGYQQKAADVFARVEQAEWGTVPDRIRFEIVNHQARTAVLLSDIDAFEFYMHRGLDGAVLLGSRQRQRELELAWQHATEKWPGERRVDSLNERLQLTMGDGEEGSS